MILIPMQCPHCHSDHVIKWSGKLKGRIDAEFRRAKTESFWRFLPYSYREHMKNLPFFQEKPHACRELRYSKIRKAFSGITSCNSTSYVRT